MSPIRQTLKRVFQVTLVFSFVSYVINVKSPEAPRLLHLEAEHRWQATFVASLNQENYSRPVLKHLWSPDTTAIILNWSRLPNVVELVKIMCTQLLDTLAVVFVWNNSPQPLTYKDFAAAQCPIGVLKIHNAPENVYFQARFLACRQAATTYCFIQDDDYFVRPAAIRAMRARMTEISNTSLHLLPAHEMLFSQSSNIAIGHTINTLFAWLGYGTMVHRSQVQDFLDLLHALNATEEVFRMADNYFTVLSNRLPELWFDQNHELGGGTPFTVGTVGEERNNKHITNAGYILDSIVHRFIRDTEAQLQYPYVSLPAGPPAPPVARALCSDEPCILQTNIRLLPVLLDQSAHSASTIITQIRRQFEILGGAAMAHYARFPLSFAVDRNPTTYFYSVNDAEPNEWIALDLITADFDRSALELALLVDETTRAILKNCVFESSIDGIRWHQSPGELECSEVSDRDLHECSIAMRNRSYRNIRVRLATAIPHRWAVYEMWVRRRGSRGR